MTAAANPRVAWLALPGVGFLTAAFALPLAALLVTSFQGEAGWTLAGYAKFFGDPFNYAVLGNTLKSAIIITLACLIIGYPTAFVLARATGMFQATLLLALVLPLSVGVVVKAFAWTILLRSNGLVNTTLTGLGLIDEPVRLLFTETGLAIGAVHVFLPFMVLPIYAVARQIDVRLTDAAASLGAGPLLRFTRVVWPLSLPGVVAGVAFVFSMAVSMYVIPSLLMGDRYKTLPTLIARSYLFMRDRQTGSTLAVVLLAIAVSVVIGSALLAKRLQSGRSA
jgi:putative spermidine/putrescine transport system permease protein